MQKDMDRDRQGGKSAARDQTEGNMAETKTPGHALLRAKE
jgi:hypothetical protein